MASTSSVDLSVAGLASGLDWKSLVSQLADVERAPERQLQSDQSAIQKRNSAYGSISSELSTLQTKIDALKDASLYGKRTAQPSDATLATATAADSAAVGTYSFQITQLAKSSVQRGATTISSPLSTTDQVSGVTLGTAGFSTAITAGKFSINGQQISVATSDSLQDVFDRIVSATNGAVSASYDPSTDKISLQSSGEIVLGSGTDTSNFLQATRLTNNGSGSVTSSLALGGVRQTGSLSSANFATPISDAGGAGVFQINGVSVNFTANDSVTDVLTRINNSTAGVSASYDSVKGQFVLASKATGDIGISMSDVSGNFLAATGLSNGTLTRGQDLLYSINGGGQLSSHSNTITQDSSGVAGLSVTALKENSTFTVDVGSDTSGIKQAINDFVTEYNKMQSLIDTYTASSTDAKGKVTAGVLADEGDASAISSALRSLSYRPAIGSTSSISSLDSLGIATNGNDNKLTVSSDQRLSDALTNNLSAVQDLFTNSTTGIAAKLSDYLDKTIGDDGTLVTKQNNLTKQSAAIDNQIADLERTVQADSDAMTERFIAMETAQQNMQAQLKYLQQTFNSSSSSK